MCEECHFEICKGSCPCSDGKLPLLGYPRAVCSVCNGKIYADEVFFRRESLIICENCAKYMTVDELAELCYKGNFEEVFEECGFEKTSF